MDIQESKAYTYFNGTLTGPVNQIFEQFVNCEVTRPSYAKKKRPSHFALKKRKGYKKLSLGTNTWGATDVKVIPGSYCGQSTDQTFIYLLSPDKLSYEIWLRPNQCGFEATKILEGGACACGYNQFTPVEYAIGTPKIVSASSFVDGVQSNVTVTNYDFGVSGGPVEGRLSVNGSVDILYGTGSTQVNIGDYVVIRTGYASGQSKRVIGYDITRKELILDTPRSGFEVGTNSYLANTASIYPRRGTTLLFADSSGPIVLNVGKTTGAETEKTIRLNIIDNKCITDITVSSGIWNFLTSEGFVVFGNAGLNTAYYSGAELVGEEFNQVVSFRGYNVFAGGRNIKAGVVITGDNGYNQNLYDLSQDIGMWSRDAYAEFKNSLYILGSNKRLYAVSISGNGSTNVDPKLELTNMSEAIVGELDLLLPSDNVTLYADEKSLKIFITSSGKTKILIYESDYGIRHTHKVFAGEITSYKEGFYIGDGLYTYCGDIDGSVLDGKFFTQEISALIGENEPNGMSFNSFQEKKLDFIKMNVGPSILNEGSSRVVVEVDRSGYKARSSYDQWSKIPWVTHYNNVFAGIPIEPDSCFEGGLVSCENMQNEFEGSDNKDATFGGQSTLLRTDLCQCPNEFHEESDMVDGYDSKSHFLADSFNIYIPTIETNPADIFRVRFISGEGDTLWFNGFFAGVIPGGLEDSNGDQNDMLMSNCTVC